MKMNELFSSKLKTYIKVTESRNGKGIETYFDIDNLRNINLVYKEQLLSVFISGVNMLSDGSLTVVRIPEQEEPPIEVKKK